MLSRDAIMSDMKVVLNSYPPDTPTGLGTCCRTLWKLLPFYGLLAVPHRQFIVGPLSRDTITKSRPAWRVDSLREMSRVVPLLADQGVNCIVSIERPMPGPSLFALAKQYKMRTVLIVMHEWIDESCLWVKDTDLFVAPNRFCMSKLQELGIPSSKITYVPFPIDLESLPFTERSQVRSWVFSNGWGGCYDRKGWPEMLAALKEMPIDLREKASLWSQRNLIVDPTLEVHSSTAVTRLFYAESDVAIVPSRFEGLGWAILEPMALGLPVLATAAPPMSEYLREAYDGFASSWILPVASTSLVPIWNHNVLSSQCSPSGIIEALQRVFNYSSEEIREVSQRGRSYIEMVYGDSARQKLWGAITQSVI